MDTRDRFVELVLSGDGNDDIVAYTIAAESLIQELREHDCDTELVRQRSVVVEGSKDAGAFIDGGKLLLTLGASGGALSTLIVAVRAWLLRNQKNKVSIRIGKNSIELDGIGIQTQEWALKEFISRVRDED